MSVRRIGPYPTLNTSGLSQRDLPSAIPPSGASWVRNPSWPSCTASSGDNKIVGLYAVWPGDGTGTGGNFFAFLATAAYTIDYGDGTVTNYASSVQANYTYNYNSTALTGTDAPVTLTDATDTVTRTAHGYTNGMLVRFYNIVATTGISTASQYYVINATANTFQVSDVAGGSAIAFTTDGTATLLPYKIATITITPQAGNDITSVNFSVKNTQPNLANGYGTGWLDVAIALPSLTTLDTGGGGATVGYPYWEHVSVSQLGAITSFASVFRAMPALASVEITADTSSVTSTLSMFYGCLKLVIAPLFNTANVTTMANMFQNCSSLTTVPLFNTASVTNMTAMFSTCQALTSVPLFNTANVTSMGSMFQSCSSLASVPLFNTANVLSMAAMFSTCPSLVSVPLFNTQLVNDMSSMFASCPSLTSVPLFNTANVTSMGGMFNGCQSLASVPLFNTAKVTSMANMFTSCLSLKYVPFFDTASVSAMNNMFNGCQSLTSVPLFNTASVTNMSGMFASCYSLTSVPLFNTANVTSMSTMFLNCYSLTSVPLFNTVKVTNTASMFSGCRELLSVPLLNTAAALSVSSMFATCGALSDIPAFNFSAVNSSTNMGSVFLSAASVSRIRASGIKYTFSIANLKLSPTALMEVFDLLPTPATPQTITVTGNYGIGNATNLSSTTTAGSTLVTMASTTGIEVGMLVTGTNTSTTGNVTVTGESTGDTISRTAHGLADGTPMSFSYVGTLGGISVFTLYYVINATVNTFQVSTTPGGPAVNITGGTDSTLTIRYGNFVTSIVPNTSVTVSTPMAGSGTQTLNYRSLDFSKALLKRWSVSI